MKDIVKLEYYFYDKTLVIKESIEVFDRRNYYDVKFTGSSWDYNYVQKENMEKPASQSHVWANFMYLSKTRYDENPQKWIELVQTQLSYYGYLPTK